MLTKIKRCEHCKSVYSHHLSGEGCANPYNNENYCPECMKLILEALKNVPEKFVPRYKEISNDSLMSELIEFKNQQLEEEKSRSIFGMICSNRATSYLDFDNIDLFDWDTKEYAICYNDDTLDEKHLFILAEYNIINKEFTSNTWNDYIKPKKPGYKSYHRGQNFQREMKKAFSNISARKLDPPVGRIDPMDFEWEIITDYVHKED